MRSKGVIDCKTHSMPSHVVLHGNLTNDPSVEVMPSGTPVLNIWVSDHTPKGDWAHHCVIVGERAYTFAERYKKGDPITVTGKLVAYKDRDGETRYEVWAATAGDSGL